MLITPPGLMLNLLSLELLKAGFAFLDRSGAGTEWLPPLYVASAMDAAALFKCGFIIIAPARRRPTGDDVEVTAAADLTRSVPNLNLPTSAWS